MNIVVLGAGAWGTALAISAAGHAAGGRSVTLWARDPAQAASMAQARSNARYLPGVALPAALQVVHGEIDGHLAAADLIVIGIACPQIIYPYLRGNVADVVTRAGFPPVHLAEINFQAMYEQQLQAAAAEGPADGAAVQ